MRKVVVVGPGGLGGTVGAVALVAAERPRPGTVEWTLLRFVASSGPPTPGAHE